MISEIIKGMSLIITVYNLNILLLKDLGFRISQRDRYILVNKYIQMIFFYSLVYNLSKNLYLTIFIGTFHFLIKHFFTKKVNKTKSKTPTPTPNQIPMKKQKTPQRPTTTSRNNTTSPIITTSGFDDSMIDYSNVYVQSEVIIIGMNEYIKKLLEIIIFIIMTLTFTTNIYTIIILIIVFFINNKKYLF